MTCNIRDGPSVGERHGRSERELMLMYRTQRRKCNYCGRKFGLRHLHVDHKKPVTPDGSERTNNLQLLCALCKTRKGDMTDGEFRLKYKLHLGLPKKVLPQEHFEEIDKAVQMQGG